MIELKDNKLIDGKLEYLFSRKIGDFLQWQDNTIIRLSLIGTQDCINNIYALKNGRILWQVQDQRHYNPKLLGLNEPLSVYTMVAIYDKDSSLLVATDSMGYRYLIDPTNGLIVGQDGWTK